MSETNLLSSKGLTAIFKKNVAAFEINGCRFFTFWCRVADEDRFNLKEHHHSFYELHVCLSGETEIEVNGHNHVLCKGQFLFLPHGVAHRIVRTSSDYSRLVWGVDISGLKTQGEKAVYRSLTAEEENILEILISYAKRGGTNLFGEITALFSAFFFSLAESSGAVVKNTANKADFFSLVDRYVRDNLSQIEGIDEVAAQFFMSGRQLTRICEEETGLTFGKYLKQIKMEKAKELLREYTVRETAEKLGYSDEFSFSRSFFKVVGETPAKTRKK